MRVIALLAALSGCGGAAPLMHTAHPLDDGQVTVGAGFAGSVNVNPPELAAADVSDRILENAATSPGFAPWVGGRVGLGSEFDAGVIYTARTIRADLRHAWVIPFERSSPFQSTAVSLSLGASGLLPKRDEGLAVRVGGFGFDLPLLVGFTSDADVYNVYFGPRGGFEYLNGQRDLEADPLDPSAPLAEPIGGWHSQIGGIFGFRVGFRYLFAIMEVGADHHWASGTIGADDATFRVFAIRPAGALVGRF